MPTRRKTLLLIGTTAFAGCASSEDTDAQTATTNADTEAIDTDAPTTTKEATDTTETMSQNTPQMLLEETHPVELDPAPPESWQWESSSNIDVEEVELGLSGRYAKSLDKEYDLFILRYDSVDRAEAASVDGAILSSRDYFLQRGRFGFAVDGENATKSEVQTLLQNIPGLSQQYIENNL